MHRMRSSGSLSGRPINPAVTRNPKPLEPGRHNQLRVYAAVTDLTGPRGYRLLPASGTLYGIFRVIVM